MEEEQELVSEQFTSCLTADIDSNVVHPNSTAPSTVLVELESTSLASDTNTQEILCLSEQQDLKPFQTMKDQEEIGEVVCPVTDHENEDIISVITTMGVAVSHSSGRVDFVSGVDKLLPQAVHFPAEQQHDFQGVNDEEATEDGGRGVGDGGEGITGVIATVAVSDLQGPTEFVSGIVTKVIAGALP